MKMEQSISLGERMRTAFKQLGLSVDEISKLLNVSTAQIYNYFNDKHTPSQEILSLLAHRGIDLNYIFTGEEPKSYPVALAGDIAAETDAQYNKSSIFSASNYIELTDKVVEIVGSNLSDSSKVAVLTELFKRNNNILKGLR